MNIALDDVWSCFRSPFSAVFQYQKKFTDDLLDQVKSKREAFNRRARDMRNRRVELHLDELEEKYLCCVCLKKGQDRDDELEMVLDKYHVKHAGEKHQQGASSTSSTIAVAPAAGHTRAVSDGDGAYSSPLGEASSAPAAASSAPPSRSETPAHHQLYDRSTHQQNVINAEAQAELEVMQMVEREVERRRQAAAASHDSGQAAGSSRPPSLPTSGRNTPFANMPDAAGGSQAAPVQRKRITDHQLNRAHSPTALMSDISPLAIKALIDQTRKAILEKQRAARLEELAKSGKLKKKKAYHRDKGLHRIHETDVEHFSIFFKKPVRGYLCGDCHTAARNKLDRLTREITAVIKGAKEPPIKRKQHATAVTSNRPAGSVPEANVPEGCRILDDLDILQLRQLMRCGVCQRRQATYFLRKTVLFLCEFCTARDKFYRDHARLICDDPMPEETVTLLRSLRVLAERSEQTARGKVERAGAKAAREYVAGAELFSNVNDVDLFCVQSLEGEHKLSDAAVAANLQALEPLPSFDCRSPREIEEEAPANRRTVARETAVSLFRGYVLQPVIDLFQQWGSDEVVAAPQHELAPVPQSRTMLEEKIVEITDEEEEEGQQQDLEALLAPTAAELAEAEAQAEREVMAMVEREVERRRAASEETSAPAPPVADAVSQEKVLRSFVSADPPPEQIQEVVATEETSRAPPDAIHELHDEQALDRDDTHSGDGEEEEQEEGGDSRSPTFPVRAETVSFQEEQTGMTVVNSLKEEETAPGEVAGDAIKLPAEVATTAMATTHTAPCVASTEDDADDDLR